MAKEQKPDFVKFRFIANRAKKESDIEELAHVVAALIDCCEKYERRIVQLESRK